MAFHDSTAGYGEQVDTLMRQYYGAKEGPPIASTLDHIVAGVAG